MKFIQKNCHVKHIYDRRCYHRIINHHDAMADEELWTVTWVFSWIDYKLYSISVHPAISIHSSIPLVEKGFFTRNQQRLFMNRQYSKQISDMLLRDSES